jgi:ATP-binding cassette subfamily B protein RaxB
MIASYHGHNVNVAGFRRRFPTNLKGLSLRQMIDIASSLHLTTRPIRVDLGALPRVRMPAILHWDHAHFVVLKEITRRGAVIHDPSHGARTIPLSELSRHFTGIALEFDRSDSFVRENLRDQISFRSFFRSIHGLKRALFRVFVVALGMELAVLAGPFFLQLVIDEVLASNDVSLLTILTVTFAAVTVFSAFLSFVRSWSTSSIGAQLSNTWVSNLFGHLLRLPIDYFEKRHVGDIVSRFNSVEAIQRTFTTQSVSTALDGLMAFLTIFLMCAYGVTLTLTVCAAFVLYTVIRYFIFGRQREVNHEWIVAAATQQSALLESIRGIQPLKLANQQAIRQSKYANHLVEANNAFLRSQRLDIWMATTKQVTFGLQKLLVIWLAAHLVLKGDLTAGMLVAFATYSDLFTTRVSSLVDRISDFRMLGLHAERISDIANGEEEAHYEGPASSVELEQSIELRNVSFRYAVDSPWVIRHCNAKFDAGESVAIAGPSGSGKTTLAKLILGLLVPTEGQILIGGVNIQRIGLRKYRQMVAAVMQDDQLFAGSIADNIAFFDPDMDLERVESVAMHAHIHADIIGMPMGFDSLVGDMGASLSGGQRQRILLARALYRQPSILLLDEATSHLDIDRERLVTFTVRNLKFTRIVIAHRLETIASADRVLHLEEGCLVPAPPMSSALARDVTAM